MLIRLLLLAPIVASVVGTKDRAELALTPLMGLSGSARAAGSESRPTAGCAGRSEKAGDSTVRVQVGGAARTARLHVSRAALHHTAPLLLAFHGTGGSGRFMKRYSGLTVPLDRAGAIGLFPDASGRSWHLDDEAGAESMEGDVAFVGALLDAVERSMCVDARRVWAAGVSNGGSFTALLACVMSDRLAGVAVVAGGFSSLPACHPSTPVSVLEIHGTADPIAPYGGHPEDGHRGAVLAWLTGWVRRDRCTRSPRRTTVVARVQRLAWRSCAGGAAVEHLRISGGRHQWPGATPPDPGPRVAISAAREIWRFLAGRRLPA